VTPNAHTRSAVLFRDGLAAPDVAASLLCRGLTAAWPVSDAVTFSAAFAAAEAARDAGKTAVFVLDYEAGALIEPAAGRSEHAATDRHVPLGYIWIFDAATWLTCDQADDWLVAGAQNAPAGCVRGSPALDQNAYAEKLQSIRAAIAEGEVYQVNFTFPIDVALYGDPAKAFLQLAKAQPTAHAVYIDMPEYQALSLSPELFFAVSGDQITVRPMKGTAPRCEDRDADRVQADHLRASEKNRAENLMIVDLLRNDLGRVAIPGSVTVDTLFEVEAYPTVHQMTSTVSARLATQSLNDMIRSLFPCGSVTGAPKVAAMQKIGTWEAAPRGLYTGTIGWAAGDRIHANVAIRTIVLDPPMTPLPAMRSGVLGVGSGIVWDSEAAEEYAECLLKSQFLLRPDPGFTLFETLRLELPSDSLADTLPLVEIYPWVRRHAQRLAASSAALGFAFDAGAFEQALWDIKAEIRRKQGACDAVRSFRVRVDLAHDGRLTKTWAPLAPLAERVALIWSQTRLAGDDPLLRHKTSARGVYDAAIEQAMAEQAFDSLFCNERGEVCEGARSNVFVREGNRLLTPPLRCGLLPGVLRSALLAQGEAIEAVLTVGDIKTASREGRLRVGNALRGLMPAFLK
jgi:para-aminobenzoate synthetase/4-amino-4-deoxychorismate lyase